MKKFLSILTAAVCVMACAFSFAACGGDTPKHTHDYGTDWVTSTTHHWHECKNDGCDQKEKDKAAHIDGDNNGKCDTCDYTMSVKTPVLSIALSQTEISLEVDGTATLTATVSPDNATNKTVIWESDKTNIATVDNTGKVSAIAQGTAKITATADGKSANCTVTVTAKPVPVTGIELDKTAITLEIDETQTLTATLAPDNATDKTVTWTVAPSGVVSVENGVITALKDGTATVTATANGKSANCTVTVNAPLTNAQVLKFLNDNVLLNAAKNCLNSSWEVNNENVINPTWYITKDGKNITGANLVFTYIRRDTAHYQTLCNIDFAKPLTIQNIRNNEIRISTFSLIYTTSINPTIQEQHTDLTNAICDKLFGEKTNAARYIIENAQTDVNPQYGDAVSFTVIEIIDIYVKEKSLTISDDGDDIKLIENINNSKYYTYGKEKNVAITGEKLENNSEPFFGKVTSLGDKVTGEQLKTVFNAGYREKAIEYQLGKTYTGNIYDEAWYVTKSEKTGNIISSTFAFYYKEGTQTRFYKYTFIFRLRPFTYDDYLNAMNGDYADIAVDSENTTHYTIEDTAPKNTEHSALVNAVMNKFRNEWNLTSNAVAEFKSLSYKAWTTINGVENVEVRTLTMTIYDGDTWVDVKLIIKYASNDSEYITNLNNNLYKPFDNRYGSSKNSYSHSAWVEQVTTVNGEKL